MALIRSGPALVIRITTLATEGNQATPTAEVVQRREAQDIADESDVDGGAILAHPLKGLQVALGMELAVDRAHCLEAQLMDLGLCIPDARLLTLEAGLQVRIVDTIWITIEGDDSLGLPDQRADPGRIGRLFGGAIAPGLSDGGLTGLVDPPRIVPVFTEPESGGLVRGQDIGQPQPGELVGGSQTILTGRNLACEPEHLATGTLQRHLWTAGKEAAV